MFTHKRGANFWKNSFPAFMAVLAITAACSGAQAADKPNFILILADDLGWGGTSVQIHPDEPLSKSDYYQTPTLEALAASGMRFTDAYAAPMCSAARQAIQTGKSPARLQHTDVIGASNPSPDRYEPLYTGQPSMPPLITGNLAASEVTIAELLKQNSTGYVTAHYGKWHVSYPAGGNNATNPAYGYDYEHMPPSTIVPAAEDPAFTFRVTESAMNFMSARVANDQPFYMQLSYSAPHYPWGARPSTLAKWQDVPPGERHNNPVYAAMVEDLDTGIGMVLDKLDQLGIRDNTYIVFASDNGAIATLGSTENIPLFQYKGSVYEGGVRTPMIVAGPGVAAGSVSNIPVTLQDIFATMSAVAGITADLPANIESANLLPILHNNGNLPDGMNSLSRGFAPNGELFYHMPHWGGVTPDGPRVPASAVRDGDYKLVREYGVGGQPDKVFLFNLTENITESNDLNSPLNLANAMPAKTAELLAKLDQWLEDVDASLPYEISDNADLIWKASQSGAGGEVWKSTTDVKSYFRERWLMQGGNSQPTLQSTTAFQPGLGRRAFYFDGDDAMTHEFFRVSDSRSRVDMDADRSASIELWVRPDSLSQNQVLFESGDGAAGLSITLGDADANGVANDLRFRVLSKSGASLTATVAIDRFANPTLDAIHTAAVFSDDEDDRYIEVYVNGALAARVDGVTGAAGSMRWDVHNRDWIGFQQAGLGGVVGTGVGGGLGGNGGSGSELPFNGSFQGDLAGVAFYNYALSSTAVAAKYNSQLHPVSFGLNGTSGDAMIAPDRPTDVSLGMVESNSLQVYQERRHRLPQNASVDAAVTGGAVFNSGSSLPEGMLTTGTAFNSYLLHFDPMGSSVTTASGSIQFDNEIIGLILNSTTLAATDAVLGSIGNYGAVAGRGLSLNGDDFISISSDRLTLSFSVTVAGDEMAQFRVLTDTGLISSDFSDDGYVTGADLDIWKASFGANSGADADGDGDSDGADFLIWQRQLSPNFAWAAAGAHVPEPGAAALMLVGIAVVAFGKRQQMLKRVAPVVRRVEETRL